MAIGMCNAPATFQFFVNTILSGVSNCNAYLDDLILFTTYWSNHVNTLCEVFTNFAGASLKTLQSHCNVFRKTGRARPGVAGEGESTSNHARQLRKSLGMAGYY